MTYCRKTWLEAASCAGIPTTEFYPNDDGSLRARTRSREQVARICAACPVRLWCLAEGLGDRWGMWGGAEPTTRREMTRSLSIDDVERLQGAVREYATAYEDHAIEADLFEKYRIRPEWFYSVTRFTPGTTTVRLLREAKEIRSA